MSKNVILQFFQFLVGKDGSRAKLFQVSNRPVKTLVVADGFCFFVADIRVTRHLRERQVADSEMSNLSSVDSKPLEHCGFYVAYFKELLHSVETT